MTGTIARMITTRGFGFITGAEDGEDVFFHANACVETPFDGLEVGDRVHFDLADSPRGVRATNVRKDGISPLR